MKSKAESFEAAKNLSFSIQQGEKVAYIGSNGAGKSTTIKMLCGIMTPSSGKIEIDGYDPYKDRLDYVKKIGVVFGHRNQLFWDLKVSDSFEFGRSMYGISYDAYIDRLKIFSKYVDLDEPTIGLDIFTKEAVRDLLNHINEKDETIIMLTSHDMVDAEKICKRILLLDKGKIAADLPLDVFVTGSSLEETIKNLYDRGEGLK